MSTVHRRDRGSFAKLHTAFASVTVNEEFLVSEKRLDFANGQFIKLPMEQRNPSVIAAIAASEVKTQSAVLSHGSITHFKQEPSGYSKYSHVFQHLTCATMLSGTFVRGGKTRLGDIPVHDPSDMRLCEVGVNPAGCDGEFEVVGQSGVESMFIEWTPDMILSMTDLPAERFGHIRPKIGINDPLVRLLFQNLRRHSATLSGADRLLADATSVVIFNRMMELNDARSVESHNGGLTPRQLKLVVEYIAGNLQRTITLNELAVLTNLSQGHFSRAFKRSTGHPPHRWLFQKRMELAQRLLRETNHPISYIAGCCGFDNQFYFSTAFTRHAGVSPRAWRLMLVR